MNNRNACWRNCYFYRIEIEFLSNEWNFVPELVDLISRVIWPSKRVLCVCVCCVYFIRLLSPHLAIFLIDIDLVRKIFVLSGQILILRKFNWLVISLSFVFSLSLSQPIHSHYGMYSKIYLLTKILQFSCYHHHHHHRHYGDVFSGTHAPIQIYIYINKTHTHKCGKIALKVFEVDETMCHSLRRCFNTCHF